MGLRGLDSEAKTHRLASAFYPLEHIDGGGPSRIAADDAEFLDLPS